MRKTFLFVLSKNFLGFNSFRQTSRHLSSFSRQSSLREHKIKSFRMDGARKSFCLDDYDCIGFDLDNTIVKYKIKHMIYHEYQYLAEFLVDRGYSKEFLQAPIEEGVDFLQKGLILDFKKGNLLRVCESGEIQIASHGTRFLSKDEIREIYGENKRWQVTDEYCKDM